jgi:hypothetical protein
MRAQMLRGAFRVRRAREKQLELALECMLVSQRPNQIL